MSAFAGIFNFNNEPLREDQQEKLLILWNGLEERGPDGGEMVVKGPVGMCYRAFHTNRESRLERQPFIGANGKVVVGDLRLDNRDQLVSELRGLLRGGPGEITDIELVMAAYEKWGDMFPLHMVGEFALMLYDPAHQEVLLTRDYIGNRTLYYHSDEERLICSSELGPLPDVVGIPLEINDEYVAGFLTRYPDLGLTSYNNIHAVKPAHTVQMKTCRRFRERRYWCLDPGEEIRYQKDQDYEEDFKRHFFEAVRAPLRSDLPVMAELSGGLDSSSIVCVADRIIAAGQARTPRLETVSSVSDESQLSDERKFICLVEEQRSRMGHHLRAEDYRFLSSIIDRAAITSLNPLIFSVEYHERVHDIMNKSGARVLLSGQGGDQIMGGASDLAPQLSDLLVQHKFRLLHKQLKAWSQERKRSYFELLWRRLLLPMLSLKVQAKLNSEEAKRLPSWLDLDFADRMHLRERLIGTADEFGFHLPSARDQSIGFLSVRKGISMGWRQEIAGVEVSYPFLHRPLVEFMQAIPAEQNVRLGQTRSLMRRALRNVLPEKIRTRKSKGNPTEIILRAFAREGSKLVHLFQDAQVCHLGYSDGPALLAALERSRHGCESHYPELLRTICLEFWLRALHLQSSIARKTAVVPGAVMASSMAMPIGADTGKAA